MFVIKEWYLITPDTRPNITSGFGNDAFVDYKDDAFAEVLATDVADDLILYNYDLSKSVELRGVIQGNIADTQLKSMERTVLVPIGTLHSGDYIFFEDEYWIVDGRPGNNKTYEKATLKECQYKLRWQKNDGTVIERWANFASASKYDVGETNDKTIILTSNNLTVIMPNDKDSMTIDGKRVFIDTSDIPEKVFKITRNDDVLFLHGSHGGTLNLIADKTELNLETDRQDLGLCNYIEVSNSTSTPPQNPDETADLRAVISGNTNLKIEFERTYTASITDADDNIIQWNNTKYKWNVVSDFEVSQKIDGNTIKLLVKDDSLIDESFLLQIINTTDNTIIEEIEITVVDVLY